MAVDKLPEFARNGQKNTDGLDQEDGFPVNLKPARQWFNFLFNKLSLAINQIIDEDYIRHDELIDNLTSSDDKKPLTAKQGKALQLLKLDKNANAVGLQMGDDRTLLPTELSPLSVQTFFGTYNSDGTSAFCDFITLNGWIDASGGRKNALVFNKISTGLYHFQADYNSQNWTIKKELAYTDSNISGNAASATRLQNGRNINSVYFDGTQDLNIEAPLCWNGTIATFDQLNLALKDGKFTVTELNIAGLYGYGFLVVIRSGGTCHQIYYPHAAQGVNNGTMAMRQSWNVNGNTATWSEWRVVGTQDDSKLPLVGGTVTGNLRVNGIIFSNKVYGDSDLWFTSEDEQKARRILTGGILASDSYSEANLIPNLGIYAKGAIHTKTGVYADKYYGYNGIAIYVGNLDGRLTTPRLINGVAFDASTDINIPPVSFYIPAGADLNNYKRTGFYYQNADVDAAKITNVPQGNAFALRVEESAGCSQWLTPYNGGGVVYYRHFYDGTWSTWIKMDPHNIDGNAATATKLKNPRKIFGQDFDGSSDVAGNITTSTGMVVSDSFHYIDMGRSGVDRMNLAVYGGIFNFINAENGNVIARLNSNGIDCNAATATKLQTPRNIAISGAVSGSANFDGSGNITINTISNNAIGIGQTWQDVASQRANNTIYVNTTGKPIQVFMCVNVSGQYDNSGTFAIDNVVMTIRDAAAWSHLSFIVPNGSSYKISVDSSQYNLLSWTELR
ncbi:pyocin knob domain-containing protein [Acinetobacter baumannii]|uniref:pyocin knob domain-containing protein n=1 Tax=Acinetobacter baumannii TaxID=470 RepID=UPI000DE61B22|nr:pyocin knob domain-containing protein [Acinetobacter baumannii]SSU98490.1 bifunctional phage-like tail fiber protein/heme utilization protein [Acinetobacter baumannii]